jgi:L,D-transpeptidase ErfK/SrfK
VHDDRVDARAGARQRGLPHLGGRRRGRRRGRWRWSGRRTRARQSQYRRHPERTHAAILSLALALGGAAHAADAPRLRPLIGEWRSTLVQVDDTLLDVAYRERLGFEAVVRLNPGVDEWIPIPGTVVRLPTRAVLPDAPEEGLVINVPEMRLYEFAGAEVRVFAAAVGDASDPTLLGEFRVGEKRLDPTWTVPASIRAEKPELPARVPPGPDNPLGGFWMTIGRTSYGIHGTNIRWSIGRMATHGCVRLYEDEIERLYQRTRTGTRLRILYQPFKWGQEGDALVLEAHPDLYGRIADPLAAALETPRALGLEAALDGEAVALVVEQRLGVPFRVGTLAAPAQTTSTRPF